MKGGFEQGDDVNEDFERGDDVKFITYYQYISEMSRPRAHRSERLAICG